MVILRNRGEKRMLSESQRELLFMYISRTLKMPEEKEKAKPFETPVCVCVCTSSQLLTHTHMYMHSKVSALARPSTLVRRWFGGLNEVIIPIKGSLKFGT